MLYFHRAILKLHFEKRDWRIFRVLAVVSRVDIGRLSGVGDKEMFSKRRIPTLMGRKVAVENYSYLLFAILEIGIIMEIDETDFLFQ